MLNEITVVPTGTCIVTVNTPYYFKRSNFYCSSTSLDMLNMNLLQNFFDTTGSISVDHSNVYDITFQFAPSDLNYSGNGSIGLTYTDTTNGKSYTLALMPLFFRCLYNAES